jgi:hypothetical protein
MSQENVELVRAAFESFLAGRKDWGAGLLDPEVEWDSSDLTLLDIGGVYRGPEAVRPERMRGRSTGTEVPFGEYAQVYTFRDGLIVRWKLYGSQSEALEAVGLGK